VVADTDFSASGHFGVRAWPTAVIMDADGHRVGRIPGLPAHFSRDLDAFLARAEGKIDDAALKQRLEDTSAVSDTPQQAAARHHQVAQRLIERGMVDAARKELEQGLAAEPKDPHLNLLMARVQVMLGESQAALDRLTSLEGQAMPHWQVGVIKAAALVALKRFDQAMPVLEETLKLNPKPGEALWLMGIAQQNRGQWQEAAAAYRAAFESTQDGKDVMPLVPSN
jgi:predicted Zn-dependent protease